MGNISPKPAQVDDDTRSISNNTPLCPSTHNTTTSDSDTQSYSKSSSSSDDTPSESEEESSDSSSSSSSSSDSSESQPLRCRAPPSPLPWTWRCHECGAKYALGVTNRCLWCGHIFCPGNSKQRGVKRRDRPCNSEFDYAAWQHRRVWQWYVAREEEDGGDRNGEAGDHAANSGRANARGRSMMSMMNGCWYGCSFPGACYDHAAPLEALEAIVMRRPHFRARLFKRDPVCAFCLFE